MPDAILALHVNSTRLRNVDTGAGHGINDDGGDMELGDHPNSLLITAVDDSENIGVFKFDMNANVLKTYKSKLTNIKKATGDVSALNDKHLFGMGYPYFICGYDNHVAVSTDYGICVLKFAA